MDKSPKPEDIQKKITKERLMIRFQLYGFFKNLRFFEPYLLVILIIWGLNLFQIGILILIQEVIIYVFEIPSGIIADKYGKKSELLLCFIFYIIGFFFYFLALGDKLNFFFILIIAAVFYGLGEAFRSGTHKAMLLLWMEKKGYLEFKTFIYGRTRSWSLLGSALNGLVSIVLILFVPAERWIFILTMIPYALDFILISTYPSYMNEKNLSEGRKYGGELIQGFKDLFQALRAKNLRKGIFSSATYDAIYKSLKDYIQPIIQIFIAVVLIEFGLSSIGISEDDMVKIILGVLYASFYLISSFSSKNAYRVKKLFVSPKRAMDILFYLFAGLLLLNAIFITFEIPIVVIFLYLFIYVFENIRRPLCVDYLGGIIKKEQRTTLLSAEAQTKSIQVLIFAPLFGLLADFNISILFYTLAGLMVIVNFFFLQGGYEKRGEQKKEIAHNS